MGYRNREQVGNTVSKVSDLPPTEQRAFLAWFAGGRSEVVKYDGRPGVFMGKAECEWVDFEDFWLRWLPELGWITVTEVDRYTAKGMVGHPEAVRYKIEATEAGWDAREAWWRNRDVQADT